MKPMDVSFEGDQYREEGEGSDPVYILATRKKALRLITSLLFILSGHHFLIFLAINNN